jgi:hypothetical protein
MKNTASKSGAGICIVAVDAQSLQIAQQLRFAIVGKCCKNGVNEEFYLDIPGI